MTPCSIEAGASAMREFMATLRKRVMLLDNSLLANELNSVAADFFSNYRQLANLFALMVKESIEKSPLPWKSIAKNNPQVYQSLTNIDTIKSLINDNTNKDTEVSTDGSKEKALDDPEAASAPKRRNFITDAYKTSIGAKAVMERTFLEGILHSLLFNANTFTQTTYLLNLNIKIFLNQLFDRIVQYLKTQGKDYNLPLYDSDGHYVGDFEKFKADYANDLKKLLPFATASETNDAMTVSRLDYLSTSTIPKNKLELDAYNAFFILTYFDDLLKIYVEPIEIVNSKLYNSLKTNDFTKYHIGETSRIEEGWQDLDREIDITELISLINKMLIEQMPVYNLNYKRVKTASGIEGVPMITRTNQNVKLMDFLRVMTTIKKAAYTKDGYRAFGPLVRTKVNSIFGKGYNNLFELIGDLNNDPNNNLRYLFKLLSSYEFQQEYDLIDLGFSFNDKNLIYSIYRGCFEKTDYDNSEPSIYLRFLNDPSPSNTWNYYSYITQTCVSVEAFRLQQYLLQQGVIENTTLADSQNKARSSHLERSISQNFSSLRPIDFKTEYIDKYGKRDPLTLKVLKRDTFLFPELTGDRKLELNRETGQVEDVADHSVDFNFIVPSGYSYYDITVNPKNPLLFTVTKNGIAFSRKNPFTQEDLKAFIPFINDILPTLGITSIDCNFLTTYLGAVSDYDYITRTLVHLASHVFMNASMVQYIKSQKPTRSSDFYRYLKDYYGANPNMRLNTHEPGGGFLSLVALKMKFQIEEVSRIYNQSQGIYGDGIVKDSEGKMINQVGSSMLATKIEQQVVSLNLKKGSATNHFSLWKGLYRGIQFTREFAGESSTQATAFNVKEHTLASLIYDFLSAYTKDNQFLNIMPSILSDKSRILKVMLDLNELSSIPTSNGKGYKTYKELNSDEWKSIINVELGTFYYKVFKDVTETFDKLQKASTLVFNIKGVRIETPFTFDYWDNFTTFNKQVEELNELLRNDNRKELSVQDILHAILLNPENQGIELTDQIHYVVNKNKLQLNQLVLSELSRFTDNNGNMHITASAFDINSKEYLDFARFVAEKYPGVNISLPNSGNTQALMEQYNKEYSEAGHYFDYKWYLDPSGTRVSRNKEVVINLNRFLQKDALETALSTKLNSEINSEQFWRIKQNDLIKDLLTNNCIIRTTNKYYEDLTSPESPEHFQALLRYLKYGSLKPISDETIKANNKWYKSGTGWIALARLTYTEAKVDENGEPVLENGKPVYETKLHLIASEADVRNLSYTKDGQQISYGDLAFNFYDLCEDKSNNYSKFELNPCIETWNTVDFLMSQEFMNSTVGTHLNHPAKKNLNGNSLVEEAERWLALVKRNVSLSATKHSFALNLLNGIRDTYRIAVVDDDVAGVFNIFGEQNPKGVKPFDGATFVCGTNNYLENNSLGANAAGINKKQFIHSYKEKSGTGIIIKTAGFAITNARINQCEFYRRMNKKMMSGKWKTLYPDREIDITQDYLGNYINYQGYFFRDGKYYQIRNIVKTATNTYHVNLWEVNEFGEILGTSSEDHVVDNNWALWNLFGGSNSKSLVYDANLGRSVLKDSESSFLNVVLAMNSVGESYDKETKFDEDNPPTSQKQVYLNLKYSNIDYVVTAGAIKQGAANVNSRRAYYDDDYELSTMEVSMHDSGILLDAEHHADNSTLSLMTQVVNALCARGYSLDRSNEVYEALYLLTLNNLRPHLEGLSKYFDAVNAEGEAIEGDKEALLDSIAGVILKGLRNLTDREGNLVQAVAETVVLAAKEGLVIKSKDLEGVIPFSHPAMYKLLTSMLASTFTREGIRLKFNGSLAVMNPSNGIWTIYGDCMLHDFDPDVTKENKTNLLKRIEMQQTMPNITEFAKLRLGYRYFVYRKDVNGKIVRDSVHLKDPKTYWTLRKRLEDLTEEGNKAIALLDELLANGEITQEVYEAEARKNRITIQEDVIKGRDLATYLADFQGTKNGQTKTYNIWDLDVVKSLYAFKELTDIYRKHKTSNTLSIRQLLETEALIKSLKSWCLDYMPDGYNFTSLSRLLTDFATNIGVEVNNLDNAEKLLRRRLQENLNIISTGNGVLQINGELIEIVKGTTVAYPYELIMPKIYATRFGLQKGDSLHDVMKNGANFFKERILSKSRALITDSNLFDIELKRTDGKHTYILYKDGQEFVDQSVRNEYLKRNLKKVAILTELDGYSWWRTDFVTGEHMMQLSSANDEIWLDDNGNEIIVTDDPKFFLENQSYYSVNLSAGAFGMTRYKASDTQLYTDKELNDNLNDPSYVSERVQSLLTAFREVDNTETNDYLDFLGTEGESGGETLLYKIQLYQDFANNPESTDKSITSIKERALWYRKLDRISNELFLAFKESLKILAARIPAQSMQSFMAMQVVGFDDGGTNEAYVNYWQLWLQGSDYDIDKVSLLGLAFTKDGRYVKWSPYFNFTNEETLKASQLLPYPTGLSIINDEGRIGQINAKFLAELADTFIVGGQLKRRLSATEIVLLGEVIRYIKEMDYLVDLDEDLEDYKKIKAMVDVINRHNTYIQSKRNQKQMLMNFIAYNMINIIADPINLIQSQSPIDDLADRVKDLSKTSRLATQTNTYAPGNVESKMNAIILTLTGKANVGIVASAMKTFEALSFYFNKVLKETLKSNSASLLSETLKYVTLGRNHEGLTICGQTVLLLANSYVNGRAIRAAELRGLDTTALKNLLATVDNDEDAFLMISALLSLATDNAKDPTLSKINANLDIIGLYTAGTALGIEFPRLVHTIMSETGDYLLGWLSGNVFQDEKKKSLSAAIDYVSEGPDMSNLNNEAVRLLATAIQIYTQDKSGDSEEKGSDEVLQQKEDNDKLLDASIDDVKRKLLALANHYGSEAIVTIFRNATESTKHSYVEMQELLEKIKAKRLEYKETQEILLHQETLALLDELSAIKTSKTTRRALENSFQEWLDYTFKSSRIKGEFIDELNHKYKVWDFFRNKVRDNPYYCNKVGLAYIDPRTNEVYVLEALTPPTEEAVEDYKRRYAEWKKQWNVILQEAREEHQKLYNLYLEKKEKYEKGEITTKPRRPKPLNLKEYKEDYALYLDALRLGMLANPPAKPFSYKQEKNRSPYEDALIERATKCLAEMPLYPSALDKLFVNKGTVYNPFESIKILSDVNSEFGTLRNILSLNQGLPSSPSEQIVLIRKFERIILNRANEIGIRGKARKELADLLDGSLLLDLHKFLYNEKYRTAAINIYNNLKVAVNVLAAAYETPHYRGYLKDLDILIQGSKVYASVYRATLRDVDDVLSTFGYYELADIENTINAMNRFYVNVLNNLFLQSKNISITIPPGQRYFDSNGEMHISDTRTTIYLGTPHGNASFKLWFEEYVIPNMKRGNFGQLVRGIPITNNYVPKFIKDMEMVEVDRTPTQNATVVYSLPVDMLPHSESATIKFKTYKNELNRMNMNIYYLTLNPETGELVQVGIPFKNLLFLYNIVAYGMENTQNSFTSIFEDMVRDGSLPIQNEYNDFISNFDLHSDLIEGRDYTNTLLLYWCAPIIYDLRGATVPYGKYYDPDALQYRLIYKKEEPSAQNAEYGDYSDYTPDVGDDGSNYRPSALELSNYLAVPDNFPSLYYIRDFIDFQESSTVRINNNAIQISNSKIQSILYNGKLYTQEELIQEYLTRSGNKRTLSVEDLTVPLEKRNIQGEIQEVPSRLYIEAILEEIFNPCP